MAPEPGDLVRYRRLRPRAMRVRARLNSFDSCMQLRVHGGSVRVLEGAIYATVFCSEWHQLVCCRTTRALAYAVGLGSSTGRAARLGHSLIAFSAPFLEV
jgi:hypothetical protein